MSRLLLILLPLIVSLFAGAQSGCALICNTDFDDVVITPPGTIAMWPESNTPCWQTSATDDIIEFWGDGFNGTPAYSGNQFIELNANMVSTIFQDFTSTPGSTVDIGFAHRGRAGTDVMSVSIGPAGGPYTTLGTFSAGNTAWEYHLLSYTFPPGPVSTYSLCFNSISAAGGNPAIGNFLDAITISLLPASLDFTIVPPTCPTTTDGFIVVDATGTGPFTYDWSPVASPDNELLNLGPGTYSVSVTDGIGCVSDTTITLSATAPIITHTASICEGDSYLFGGTPLSTAGTYSDTLTAISGCDSIIVLQLTVVPVYSFTFNVTICEGSSFTFNGDDLSLPGLYIADLQSVGGCDSTIVLQLQVQSFDMSTGPDQAICAGETAILTASGADTYWWAQAADPPNGETVTVHPDETTLFLVTGTDSFGCTDTDSILVSVAPVAPISAGPDVYSFPGEAVQLHVEGPPSVTYIWSPAEYLSCNMCPDPVATTPDPITYTVTYTAANGCTISDQISILFEPVIYIPNAFSPDANGFNENFGAVCTNVGSLEMTILDRWGEEIAHLLSPDDRWDGTYNGKKCPNGVYTWKIRYTDMKGIPFEQTGHVTVIW